MLTTSQFRAFFTSSPSHSSMNLRNQLSRLNLVHYINSLKIKLKKILKDHLSISSYVSDVYRSQIGAKKHGYGDSRLDLSSVFTSDIVFFPLFFKDRVDEKHFVESLSQVFHLRLKIGAITSMGVYLIYWLCSIICLLHSGAFKSNLVIHILYSLSMFYVVASYSLLYISIKRTFFTGDLEHIFSILLFMNAFVHGFWIYFYDLAVFYAIHFSIKSYLNLFIYIIPVWSVLLMDAIVQIRTKASIINHIVICLIFSGLHAVRLIFMKQNVLENAPYGTNHLPFNTSSYTLSNLCVFISLTIFLYVRRWFIELQERINFLQRKLPPKEPLKLRTSHSKGKEKEGTTIVVHLTSLVQKVVCNISELLVEPSLPCLVDALDVMKRCQEILTDTTNLYSVRCQSLFDSSDNIYDSIDEGFLQHYQSSQEGNTMQDIHEGDDHEGDDLDDHDMIESLRESCYHLMERNHSGSFEQHGTLKSYGLLNLNTSHQSSSKPLEVSPPLIMAENLCVNLWIDVRHLLFSMHHVNKTWLYDIFVQEPCDAFDIGRSWDLNMLRLAEKYPNIILEVGANLLQNKLEDVNATSLCLYNYLYKLQSGYHDNPYHNKVHAAAVAHATSCLLNMFSIHESPYYSSLNYIAIIIAALGHDVGHPGRSNSFFVNTSDHLALIYNDTSVLENTHSAIIFKCLDIPGANIFAEVSPDMFHKIRKRIIEMILITDMGNHFESVSRFELRQKALGFNYHKDLEDMWLVIRMCLKCADLSHTMVDWPQHLDWSLRVVEEFYQQVLEKGDQEKALGLKVSPLFDRSFHSEFCKAQRGFIDFIVQPLLTQLEELDPESSIREKCVQKLHMNKSKWDELVSQCVIPEIPQEYQNMRTNPRFSAEIVVSLYIPEKTLVPMKSHTKSL